MKNIDLSTWMVLKDEMLSQHQKQFWEVLPFLHDSYILNAVLIFAIQCKWRDKIFLLNYRITQKWSQLFQSFPFLGCNQHQS